MNAIAVGMQDTKQIQDSRRYRAIATFFVIVISIFSFIGMIFSHLLHQDSTYFVLVAMGIVVSTLLAGSCILCACFFGLHSTQIFPMGVIRAWILIGGGLCALGLGNFLHVLCDIFAPGYQGGPVIVYLITYVFYPLAFAGFVHLPGVKRLRMSVIFELLITMSCCAAIFWFAVSFTPVLRHNPAMLVQSLHNVIPLSGDVFLLMFLIGQLQRGIPQHLRHSFILMTIGLGLFLYNDIVHSCIELMGRSYSFGSWFLVAPAFVAGFLLIGLSVLYQYHAVLVDLYHKHKQKAHSLYDAAASYLDTSLTYQGQEAIYIRFWRIESLYVPLAIIQYLLLFMLPIFMPSSATDASLVYFRSTAAVISLAIVVRHYFATNENARMLYEREKNYRESEQARYLATQLTDILDIEHLCERTIDTVLKKLGFTSILLLLIEEYDSPLTSQSHLVIRGNSLGGNQMQWRLNGDTLLYHVVASGKFSKILRYHVPELPKEIRRWSEQQHVESIDFYPLVFQGKILGSMGVARHILSIDGSASASTMRIYTEQIAAIIEHAYLYQEAREREVFARSMANISARLNAIVMEPVEISQLICAEGVNVLGADHVIFYQRRDESDILDPLSAYIGTQGRVTDLLDWPQLKWETFASESGNVYHPFLLNAGQAPISHVSEATQESDTTLPMHKALLCRKLVSYTVRTAIVAPLVTGGELIGLLIFARSFYPQRRMHNAFISSDLPHIQDFVEQACIAFTNAQLYQRLSNANERLKELDQMKDQFIVTASHELRTPLTAVQGYIELVAQYDEMLPAAQRQEFLQKAQLGCEELAVLLRNVMDASRIDTGVAVKPALLVAVSVKEMLEKVRMMIDPQAVHEQRAIRIEITSDVQVRADPIRLHQILLNVCSNALKYSPARTPICLSATRAPYQEGMVIISIRDFGNGVKPQDQSHLFQRFYRLERDMNSPVRGSGLGLYISQRLVQAMGGKIWIESQGIPGEGSIFHIQLPMA